MEKANNENQLILSEVIDNICMVSNINDFLGKDAFNSEDWDNFKDSWNELDQDNYMNDDGKYRFRNFCKARYLRSEDTLWMKEYDHYYQPTAVNPLNGGIKRWFSPIKGEVFHNSILNQLLKKIGYELSELTNQDVWNINIYQNRIIAEQNQQGKPSPEGIHNDGVKYSTLLMINRENVSGGINTIFDQNKTPIFDHTLTKEGECIFFQDTSTYHFASPIVQVDPNKLGIRDLLVVEFY
ncbi:MULTISPECIES: 2OG-Fe dioxygenase family protein [Aliivibrio]|uniref:2OG-Fe dioxygenase family protein n=2 Tax=Aliivibrio TaxID=511678 RepID=A0A4Q5KUP5_9GAMM|nr:MULTISPECIES: 2OG-Fe dioxygenase family protein [Aliivibrio]MDD9177715.1 2OG-Fe dioxygenase family protein [Aliivibrio sp. A6]PQJ93812.1 hypothetical protein BTO23_06910 [Aliivibrio sifiae]RYU50891.1 hypothetical protein ERW56_13730 [Aliivibrio finisterrensis]RYU51932.1 hypothetical protein ERW57_08465 [Aliivibrio finisterrensis]RYU56833.1 hypothetical protein ERW50_13610 [Aliivibrio finisterrensis]